MECLGGNGSWVFFLFFLLAAGGGWGGMGGNAFQGALTRAELYDGLNMQSIDQGVRGVQNGLCDGFYAQNTTMLQGFNGIQRDLCTGFSAVNAGIAENRFAAQQCCCETNRNIDAVRYDAQKNTCDITSAIHAEGEATRALINANTMQDLRDRLADRDRELMTANFQLSQQAQSANLVDQLRPCARPAYLTCSPYQAIPYSTGCGCGYYNVTAVATVAAASTGPVTLSLLSDGATVEGGVATTTVPGASDDVILTINRTIYIPKWCNGSNLSFTLSGLDGVSVDNFTVDVFKH